MRRCFLVGVALLILAAVPHWRTLFLGELPLPEGYLALIAPELKPLLRPTPWNALWWDGIGQFWAWRTEAMRQLTNGRLPLWTNRVGCGFPFLDNPQTQSLYPPTFVGQWLSNFSRAPLPLRSARLIAWLAFLHTFLALLGAYLLLRSLALSQLSSLVGAAAFGLGSFQTAWLLLPTLPATASWLPLTLFCLRRLSLALDNFSPPFNGSSVIGWLISFALSLAMLLLAGHGQIALYALLAVVLFAALELAQRRKRWQFVAAFVVGVVLALLLSSAQLLPTMELTPFTHRHAPPTWDGYRAFARRGLTLPDWATMVLPFLFGNPTDGSYFGKESFADYCAYAGFGVFALALFAISHFLATFLSARPFRSSLVVAHRSFLCAFALFLLGALLASGSSFNLPFYFFVPGFAQLGTPSRALFLCQLALGMMAAVAIDGQRTKSDRREVNKWVTVGMVTLLPVMVMAGVGWWLSRQVPNFDGRSWLGMVAAQNTGILAGVFAVLLFSLNANQSPVAHRQALFRYGFAILLLAELCWFSAQQLPTARPEMITQALRCASRRLRRSLSSVPRPSSLVPIRLLLLGDDWSLIRVPRTVLPPNSVLLLEGNFADVRNYDSLLLRQHKAILALFSGGDPCPPENGNLILLPHSHLSLGNAERLAKLVGAIFAGSERVVIGKRCFIPQRVRYVPHADDALAKLPQSPDDVTFIVASSASHRPDDTQARLAVDADSLLRAKVIAKSAVTIHPAWLVLADMAYPGWCAFQKVNDRWRSLPITVANGVFRACHLPSLRGDVLWVYFPSSFAVGAFLCCIGVTLLITLLTFGLGEGIGRKG
ncbi:MAG: hypothetical protein SLRJCFUN_001847 [Candidatus Fervidibacter sp.]